MGKFSRAVVLGGGSVALGFLVWVVGSTDEERPGQDRGGHEVQRSPASRPAGERRTRSEPARDEPGGARAERLVGAADRQTLGVRRDLERAEHIRSALRRYWRERASDVTTDELGARRVDAVRGRMPIAGPPGGPSPLADYMTNVITEQYVPLVRDCTSGLLERKPGATGELTLDTTISGMVELGGVVEDVGVAEGATFDDPEFVLCIQQSLYALVLDAPPEDQESLTLAVPIVVRSAGEVADGP